MSYATVADLETYIGDQPPAGAERMLERASDLLDSALVSVWYATDTNGTATDAAVIAGLNKACCAQVEWWLATGDEMGDLSRTTKYTVEGVAVEQKSGRLCDRALDALRVAGLYPSRIAIYIP